MAVVRPIPTCSYCGKATAKGIYKDESDVPCFLRLIGDTFLEWDFKECNCKGAKRARKEHKKEMEKWHKEHPFNLQKILDSKGAMAFELNKIHHTDWMNNGLPDKSVQLLIADPPYFEVKGKFDFIWKTFDEYLQQVELWAKECKRLLADNGTLFWYGHAKKIAYAQVIFDKLLCLENNIAIEFNRQTKKGVEEFRCFAPVSERLLMYSTGNDYHDNVRLAIKYIQDYLNTITNRDELAKILLETGNCRNFESAKQNANNILSQKSAKPQMITQFQYDLIPNTNKKDYEILKQEYEALRIKHEELRRPFNNFKKLFDIMSFDQEAHITGKYEHDTCKPETLTRTLILTCSREKDLVMIPFAGSGTECAMASKENRNFIGFDIEEKYVTMANDRNGIITMQPNLFH